MTKSSTLLASTLPFLLCAMITRIDAFGLVSTSIKPISNLSPSFTTGRPPRLSTTISAAEGDAEEVEDKVDQEVSSETADEKEGEEEEATEPEIDPKIEALKENISKMESTLKQKNRDLSQIQDFCDDYSKNGYARKVAQLEDYRRSKKAASTDSTLVAKATVLQSFLPLLDDLESKGEVYADDEFAQKYSGLGSDFKNTLKGMGVTEYSAVEGEQVSTLRINTIEEDFSESIAKGCVISPVRPGYELEGNVMRMADAIVSRGSEAEAEAKAKSEAEGVDDDGEEIEGETASDNED